jgi:uncharacterized protein (TIGR02145 family)
MILIVFSGQNPLSLKAKRSDKTRQLDNYNNHESKIMERTKILTWCFLLVSLLLLLLSSCTGVVKDHDGNLYKTTKIGKQKWMSENLAVSHFRNGDTIPEVRSDSEWEKSGNEGKPAWCYEDNNPGNDNKYGKLYNWYAVSDLRGLAPDRWHVPSDAEWLKLTTYMGGPVFAALKMRTSGLTGEGNKETGNDFKSPAGGTRNNHGIFYSSGSYGYWWSSTEFNSSKAWIRILDYLHCYVNSPNFSKQYGLSVRCIQD